MSKDKAFLLYLDLYKFLSRDAEFKKLRFILLCKGSSCISRFLDRLQLYYLQYSYKITVNVSICGSVKDPSDRLSASTCTDVKFEHSRDLTKATY